jgi:protocatechuate 3,4-dioxygenase beta subunit
MRVPLLATLLLSLLTCAAGAAGMYVYMSHDYEMRAASRREAPSERDVADADGVKTGNLSPDGTSRLDTEKGAKREVALPKPETKTEEPKPAGSTEAAPAPASSLAKPGATPEGLAEQARAEAAKKEAENLKKEIDDLGDLGLEDMLAKRVEFSVNVSGTVNDSKGNPVAGADVYADINERLGNENNVMMVNFNDSGEKFATSDGGGNFSGTVKGQAGEKSQVTLVLRAKAKGYAESKKVNVDAKNGDTKTDVKLSLQGAGSVRGRVVDQSGAGVSGVTVSLTSQRGNNGMEFGGEIVAFGGPGKNAAVTDSTGAYLIEDVAEGSYAIALKAPGFREKSGPRNVDVKPDQVSQLDSDFVLAETTCLRAKLIGEDGKALSGWANVELTPVSGTGVQRLNAAVGADGSLVINDPPVGDFNVVVKLWGYFDSAKIFQSFTLDLTSDLGILTLTPNPEAGKGTKRIRVGKSVK